MNQAFTRQTRKKNSSLKDYDTGWEQTEDLKELGKDGVKERARVILEQNLADLTEIQQLLYADNTHSLLIIFQAMDAAGKDGAIKHVMSGVNPQGCEVNSFKAPSAVIWALKKDESVITCADRLAVRVQKNRSAFRLVGDIMSLAVSDEH